MSFHDLMNKKATVKRLTKTDDAYGSWSEVSDTRYTGMPCRVQPMSGRERSLYDSERVLVTHKMFCPGQFDDLDEKDVVYVDGVLYRVKVVRDIDLLGHHLEIEMEEIRGPI